MEQTNGYPIKTGSELKTWRDLRGMTQEDLRLALGLPRKNTISEWEREGHFPPYLWPAPVKAARASSKSRITVTRTRKSARK
jgi:transcriptional regulator with XRE-family HTH domain